MNKEEFGKLLRKKQEKYRKKKIAKRNKRRRRDHGEVSCTGKRVRRMRKHSRRR